MFYDPGGVLSILFEEGWRPSRIKGRNLIIIPIIHIRGRRLIPISVNPPKPAVVRGEHEAPVRAVVLYSREPFGEILVVTQHRPDSPFGV